MRHCLEEGKQLPDEVPFLIGPKGVERLYSSFPLSAAGQSARIAEYQELAARPRQGDMQLLGASAKSSGSMRMTSSQAKEHPGGLAVGKRFGPAHFDRLATGHKRRCCATVCESIPPGLRKEQ